MSQSHPPALTAGRTILSFVAVIQCIGPYWADWNTTHVMNPNWPPHARFHNGQTMSLGLCLGLLTGYLVWRPVRFSRSNSNSSTAAAKPRGVPEGISERESITLSAVVVSFYWIAGLSAILYPGALWVDPEFGTGAPQIPIFSSIMGIAWTGWGLEMWRLSGTKVKGS